MDMVKVKHSGHTGLIEIPESDLGDLSGLERFFGFREFKEGFNSGYISPRDEIRIPDGFVNPDDSVIYHWDDYIVVNKKEIDDGSFHGSSNPRKKLKAIHWYLQKN
jgi:hypothetical protein